MLQFLEVYCRIFSNSCIEISSTPCCAADSNLLDVSETLMWLLAVMNREGLGSCNENYTVRGSPCNVRAGLNKELLPWIKEIADIDRIAQTRKSDWNLSVTFIIP